MNLAIVPPATTHWLLRKIGLEPREKPPSPPAPESRALPAPVKPTAIKPPKTAPAARTHIKHKR
jgi:hypothetical protein